MMRIGQAGLVHLLVLGLVLVTACGPEEPVVPPQSIAESSPFRFPVELWDQGIEGESVLRVYVTAEGAVDSVAVHRSSGYPEFDAAAVAGARALRFDAARRGDERVAMWVRLPVRFEKEGVTAGEAREAQP